MSKKLYLVETVSMFRLRYVVECKTESDALDSVTTHTTGGEELKEFSQEWLDEVVSSSRKISRTEYMDLFDKDNDYLKTWSDEEKMRFINSVEYTKYTK